MSTHQNKMTNVNNEQDTNAMVEKQIANNIIELLNNRAQQLTAPEKQRLAAARSLAVNQLTSLQTQAIGHHGINQSGSVLQWLGHHVGEYFGHHKRVSAVLMIGAVLLTFFAVQQFGFNHHLENSDAFLLASDLPPEAYADKGFNAWLGSN